MFAIASSQNVHEPRTWYFPGYEVLKGSCLTHPTGKTCDLLNDVLKCWVAVEAANRSRSEVYSPTTGAHHGDEPEVKG